MITRPTFMRPALRTARTLAHEERAWLLALPTALTLLTTDATGARGAGHAALAVLYAGHGAWAAQGWGWAGAWSSFSLRSAIDPGGKNNWQPAAIAGTALVVLLAAAAGAARRRDLEAGLIRLGSGRQRPLRARGPVTLALRRSRIQMLT
ncbi:hypothetical protein [Actinomyces sp.]|uniref:hypothetical protein n=1 Tax=Actinomyces sp. TaxID=29317 RepID=UPI0026DD1F3A|nr:hypothetical protein [Actinomyces sp.]MDO4901335.1 hypothetical protein [Actinomyces sp.]